MSETNDQWPQVSKAIKHVEAQLPPKKLRAGQANAKVFVTPKQLIKTLEAIGIANCRGKFKSNRGSIAASSGCSMRVVGNCIVWLEAASLITVKKAEDNSPVIKIVVNNLEEFTARDIPWATSNRS